MSIKNEIKKICKMNTTLFIETFENHPDLHENTGAIIRETLKSKNNDNIIAFLKFQKINMEDVSHIFFFYLNHCTQQEILEENELISLIKIFFESEVNLDCSFLYSSFESLFNTDLSLEKQINILSFILNHEKFNSFPFNLKHILYSKSTSKKLVEYNSLKIEAYTLILDIMFKKDNTNINNINESYIFKIIKEDNKLIQLFVEKYNFKSKKLITFLTNNFLHVPEFLNTHPYYSEFINKTTIPVDFSNLVNSSNIESISKYNFSALKKRAFNLLIKFDSPDIILKLNVIKLFISNSDINYSNKIDKIFELISNIKDVNFNIKYLNFILDNIHNKKYILSADNFVILLLSAFPTNNINIIKKILKNNTNTLNELETMNDLNKMTLLMVLEASLEKYLFLVITLLNNKCILKLLESDYLNTDSYYIDVKNKLLAKRDEHLKIVNF